MCLPISSFSSPDAHALTIKTQEALAPTVHNAQGRFSKLVLKPEKEAQEMPLPTKSGGGAATAVTPMHGK